MLNTLQRAVVEIREMYPWSMIPVIGKVACIDWKEYQIEPATTTQLLKLFAPKRVTGIAVIAGKVSGGLAVRDFDVTQAFENWLSLYQNNNRDLPVAQSHRGGHIYLTGPSFYQKLPDGEYRGDSGHYTVMPPSLHPSGLLYKWLVHPNGVIPTPSDLSTLGLQLRESTGTSTVNYSSSTNIIRPTSAEILKVDYSLFESARMGGWIPSSSVCQVIALYVPRVVSQRNFKILGLVRALKRLPVKWDNAKLKVVFEMWWEKAVEVVGTKDKRVSAYEFIEAWKRCGKVRSQLDVVSLVKRTGDVALPRAFDYYSESYKALARVCNYLKCYYGDSTFYLSNHDAGRVMGLGEESGRLALRHLVQDGFLERIEVGNSIKGKASRYRCVFVGG